jgi:hypothetical protein
MTETRWAAEGPDDASLELGGHKFSSNDKGAPVMCNLVCSSMGRHTHIDFCCTDPEEPCEAAASQHMDLRIIPEPDRPKDAVTHSLYWKRTGSSRAIVSRSILTLIYFIYWQVSKVTFRSNLLIYALRLPTRPIHP